VFFVEEARHPRNSCLPLSNCHQFNYLGFPTCYAFILFFNFTFSRKNILF